MQYNVKVLDECLSQLKTLQVFPQASCIVFKVTETKVDESTGWHSDGSLLTVRCVVGHGFSVVVLYYTKDILIVIDTQLAVVFWRKTNTYEEVNLNKHWR